MSDPDTSTTTAASSTAAAAAATKKRFGTFNGKWCEGEAIFGFDEVDNFTVELIPCWHSFPVQFETRHGVMCHAASKKRKKHKTWTLWKKNKKNPTRFKQKASVEKRQG